MRQQRWGGTSRRIKFVNQVQVHLALATCDADGASRPKRRRGGEELAARAGASAEAAGSATSDGRRNSSAPPNEDVGGMVRAMDTAGVAGGPVREERLPPS